MEPQINLIEFDKFNIIKPQICKNKVLCLSNICKETDSIFVQRDNGVFGEYFYSNGSFHIFDTS